MKRKSSGARSQVIEMGGWGDAQALTDRIGIGPQRGRRPCADDPDRRFRMALGCRERSAGNDRDAEHREVLGRNEPVRGDCRDGLKPSVPRGIHADRIDCPDGLHRLAEFRELLPDLP